LAAPTWKRLVKKGSSGLHVVEQAEGREAGDEQRQRHPPVGGGAAGNALRLRRRSGRRMRSLDRWKLPAG